MVASPCHIRAGHRDEDGQRLAAPSPAQPNIHAQDGLILKPGAARAVQRGKAAELCIRGLHNVRKHLDSMRDVWALDFLARTAGSGLRKPLQCPSADVESCGRP